MRFRGWGQSVTENELFMIIKLDVASSAVSFTFLNVIFFLERLKSQLLVICVQILMTGTGGLIRFYHWWNSTVLLRTLRLMSVDRPTANHPKCFETAGLIFS